jgi:cell division septation protein DedD
MIVSRFFGLLACFLACLLTASPWDRSAGAGEEAVSVTIEACGAMAPQPADSDIPRPARLVRADGVLWPGDAGLGCRFMVTGKAAKDKAVTVEARLARPDLVGSGQALDRWFVPARRGETAVAEHLFGRPGEALAGTWTLKLFIGGRLVAEKPFEIKAALAQAPQDTTAPEVAVAVTAETPPADIPKPMPDLAAAVPQHHPEPPAQKPLPKSELAVARPQPVRPSGKAAPKVVSATPRPSRSAGQTAPARLPAAPPLATRQGVVGYFALQTGLFAEPGNAWGQASRLRGRGFPACVSEEQGPAGKRYRVLAGRFGDRHSAMALRAEVATAAGGKAMPQAVDPTTAARLRCQ